MGLFGNLFGGNNSSQDTSSDLDTAEEYIRDQDALYRHYCIPEVKRHVGQWTGVDISDDEAVGIVQKIRSEKNMGPIRDYNMPGFVDEE